jgi:hypothetical protein
MNGRPLGPGGSLAFRLINLMIRKSIRKATNIHKDTIPEDGLIQFQKICV